MRKERIRASTVSRKYFDELQIGDQNITEKMTHYWKTLTGFVFFADLSGGSYF
jgi:hypothetical protein